jgi:hypothetical protein
MSKVNRSDPGPVLKMDRDREYLPELPNPIPTLLTSYDLRRRYRASVLSPDWSISFASLLILSAYALARPIGSHPCPSYVTVYHLRPAYTFGVSSFGLWSLVLSLHCCLSSTYRLGYGIYCWLYKCSLILAGAQI